MEVLRRLCARRDLLRREIQYWKQEAAVQTEMRDKKDCLAIVRELCNELVPLNVRIKKLIASN